MIDTIFKGVIDIHGGGIDLKFPHHENEIAQAEAMHHNHIANYWLHTAMMDIKGQKMSKSLGNVILAKDAIKEYGADTIRLLLLNCDYRSVLNFSDDTVKDASSIVTKLASVYKQLNLLLNVNDIDLNGNSAKVKPFLENLANDINIPNGVTNLLDLIKEANVELRKKDKDLNILKEDFYAITKISYILGLHFTPSKLSDEDLSIYKAYLLAKENKDFAKSDELRKTLIEKNIL